MNKKILLITRCSRTEFLENIRENICSVFHDVDYHWHIVFDLNRMKMTPELMSWLENTKKQINLYYSFSGSNDELYGSNLANQVLFDTQHIMCDWAYLLDDDNALPNKIREALAFMEEDAIIYVPQLRKNKETQVIETHYVTDEMTADNCVGWVDSAQFFLRTELLKSVGGYVDGYCIDGLTIQKIYQTKPYTKRIYVEFGLSCYNYWTEIV